jgi:hypothetical protein
MIVYLAGFETYYAYFKETPDVPILSTFFYHRKRKVIDEFAYSKQHILDSGAFSAFSDIQQAKNIDWLSYTKKYIEFIKKTDAKLFFELDIDAVVGLEKVEYYRKMIEDAIGRPTIPCWHSNRGAEYYIKCCEDYPYVALGTTSANADGKKIRSNPEILQWFIHHAKKNNAKIHGLGFTNIEMLHKLKFDSVDSTSWISGQKFGNMHKFNGQKMIQYQREKGQIMINPKLRLKHNFDEWVKFQEYAKEYL